MGGRVPPEAEEILDPRVGYYRAKALMMLGRSEDINTAFGLSKNLTTVLSAAMIWQIMTGWLLREGWFWFVCLLLMRYPRSLHVH
jgi:hypothetical protein